MSHYLLQPHDLNYAADLTHMHANRPRLLVDLERLRDTRGGGDSVTSPGFSALDVDCGCALVVARWLWAPSYSPDAGIDGLVRAVFRNVFKYCRAL